MFHHKFPFLFFLFICLFFSKTTFAQLSKKHFIPPLTSAEFGNANPENQYFYISTPSNQNVNYTIHQVGLPNSSDITGNVSKTSPQEIFIGTGNTQLFLASSQTSTITNDKGYIIEADAPIYVSIRMLAGGNAQAGALVSKGTSALGNTFRIGSFTNENPQSNYLNFASVMATEDNTTVSFSDLPTGIAIKNYSGSFPININLNEGESYIIATNSSESTTNRDGLIGTLINSNNPIVVNAGSANGSFHNGGGRDYGIDQIVGLDKVGTAYIFVKGDGLDGWENALIVAHENNTTISINGNSTVATINAGEYYLIEGNNYNTNGNMFVETSKKVFAYQGVGASTSEANQGLFFVPPLSCENRGKVDNIPNIQTIGGTTFNGGITIVTNKTATVTINNQAISSFNTSGPFNVDGNSEYVTYKVTNLTNNISIESTGELYCAYFNFNGAATSGSFYSGFPSAPEINFDTTVQSLGNCIPNVTLASANTELFDTFEWFFDDENGGGFVSTGITTPNYKPSLQGRYKLIGYITCTNTTFESIVVPVSLCPDDFDNDLIIDNIDIDIDNDGILNCEESIGNATLNLADITAPSILFEDNSTNSAIVSSSFTQTNSAGTSNIFTGDAMGNFQSRLNISNNSSLTYALNFTQNVNFKLTQKTGTNHNAVNGEFFILKIAPNNKNITLLDPDDTLLIDTNFDGVFETGVTNISAVEIHFTYNPNPTGNTPFQFVANQINQISFEHTSTGIETSSAFNGTISLTCFSLDSDGDGIENMFDLDSDNDGIPDISEAFSQPISISGEDANQDGLDDAFFDAHINLDIDQDGIKNYIDLDSDNDGIFDTTEAGHNLDTDFDGIVDNANTTVGINGLVDALEDVPDTKVLALNYEIANTDNDIEFDFVELDSDDDACNDVIEAGFTDQNNDGYLGGIPIQVDANGKVINTTDGYTNPNSAYITATPITINTPFTDVIFCENSTETITIDTNADSFQWQVSTDGTTYTNITYNTTYSGATTTALQISNIPLSFNNYKFKVELNRTGNICGSTSNEITLKVNRLPTIKTDPVILKQCDDDPDLITTFNLTLAEKFISDNYTNETFTYFATEADAIAGTPEVTDKIRYPVNTIGEAWVRTISEFDCYKTSKIELIVGYAADNPYDETFTTCDDFLDTDGNDSSNNDDTDGISFFNFSAATNNINIDPNIEVFYYETSVDRTAAINEITDTTNYRNNNIPNTSGNPFPIYYKLISKLNNSCTGIGQIYLQVHKIPITNTPDNIILCDDTASGDSTDGINTNINLREKVTAILGTTQTETDFIVSFHSSAIGAKTNTDTITNDTNFSNTPQSDFTVGDISEQTIFVRVQDSNTATNCFNDHSSFKIIINPIPTTSKTISPLVICDIPTTTDSDPRNRIAQNINLTTKEVEILAGKTNHKVAFFSTQEDADNETPEITNPENYQNDITLTTFPPDLNTDEPGAQTIYFKIINLDGNQCSSEVSTFQLRIHPEPNIPENITDYDACDNTSDSFTNDNNGINGDISLKSKTPEILANYPANEKDNFKVTFYTQLALAEIGDEALALNEDIYQNTANNETIFIRIENTITSCTHTHLSFNINIKPLPFFTVQGEENIDDPQILCINDKPLTLKAENPSATYNYEWTDENGTILGTNNTLDIENKGKYTVTASDQNPNSCSRSRTIVVNEYNTITLEEENITIINELNNNGSEDQISIKINTEDNALSLGDYQYAIIHTDSNTRIPVSGFQDDPLFENLEGGIYTIIVNDKNGCSPDSSLSISVIQFPNFFTPNNDGINDSWTIKGAYKTFYSNSSITIFNRFGKIIAQIPIDSQGWDGTYKGRQLPSGNYWFSVQLTPANSNKQIINKKGNFSLLRK